RMSGSGVGFTYDEQRDTMWILDQADVKFAADKTAGPMAFTAGAFGYARRDRYMRFERTMHMDREGELIDANESTVRLFPDRDETDYLELRGNAKVTGGPNSNALRSMTARDINLDYADDGRTLQNATLAGSAAIQLAAKGGDGQRLGGEYMEVGLEPDGSVRSLTIRDAVTVSLPATKDTAARTIRSNSLVAAGNAQGIREMKFSESVEYREAATKTQGARIAKAKNLDAQLDPAAGTLQQATFHGSFDFTDGPLRAFSNEAGYNVTAGTLALTGKEITPEIRDEALTLLAEAIDVTLNPRKMVAKGNVRSTLLPPKKPAGNAAATKRPALLGDKDPVSILSNMLTYDESIKKADYTGQTRLLQGQTTINADKLTLDEAKGDLTATGKVITNLQIANKNADPAEKTKPTVARAETFTYSDDTRKATYSTAAQLVGEQGHLSAGTLQLQLGKVENALDSLEATGLVTALVDKRTVTGAKLNYSPVEEKYEVVGAPVKMIDAECQETTGKKLTFWKASDRVLVDGNNEVRTQTKGGGKCPATPPQ
ncbi:MAG: LptA/OstA family protein, partial [Vicinamibacterales bacterium]